MLNINGIFYIFFISFIHYNTLRADITNKVIVLQRLNNAVSEFVSPSILNCSLLLKEFAEAASNFTQCSILHARPVRLCEKCIDDYVIFRNKYLNLLKPDENGTSCKDIYISNDRLDVVFEYHANILSVWDKGNCNGCYDWSNGAPEISNNTKHFYQYFNETMECIINNLSPDAENYTKVCENCMANYLQLNNFYESLSLDPIGLDNICMDVVDSMNETRSIWSKDLNCCKLRKSPEVVFLCCTGIIALLPILYYLAVRFCGPIRDLPNVLKQSRFKQTILRSMNGRTN